MPERPNCAVCDGEIPAKYLTDADVEADPNRPYYCSMACMNKASDAHAKYCDHSFSCADAWCSIRKLRDSQTTHKATERRSEASQVPELGEVA